ncbi:hypothetical protein CYMTET_32462, partial [Cymbomonas tetramitiformis]
VRMLKQNQYSVWVSYSSPNDQSLEPSLIFLDEDELAQRTVIAALAQHQVIAVLLAVRHGHPYIAHTKSLVKCNFTDMLCEEKFCAVPENCACYKGPDETCLSHDEWQKAVIATDQMVLEAEVKAQQIQQERMQSKHEQGDQKNMERYTKDLAAQESLQQMTVQNMRRKRPKKGARG